ncbi:MAG TPA: aminoacyl--tRNA ligase-related protein [Candidatus Kapabacteria bacterium]|nr:aminoacyl--tRNA ligase-related protein [Candidatus Kapabacteria bacterium]
MRQTQLLTKTTKDLPKDEVSLNAQLLIRAGFVNKVAAGIYSFLPLGTRVLARIEQIIREEMNKVGGQEILMPALQPRHLWDTTGRWDSMDVLFKLKDTSDKEYTLGATHEEVVTPLAQNLLSSYKDFPQAVYQIQTKFRNEARAKSGLLRGREFRMKDLYSFHTSQEDLDAYYEQVKKAYFAVFERCGLGSTTHLVYASGGAFSKYSHEYQTITEAGEDHIFLCSTCGIGINKEILDDLKSTCPECGNSELKEEKAIEVGNIFKLGTRFSDACTFNYVGSDGQLQPVIMGCYGIGSSRLLGAIVEVHHDTNGMQWPKDVAPYHVHLVSLCKEEVQIKRVDEIYASLIAAGVSVLYDDRVDVRAGEKFADSDLIGIPTRFVVSAKTLEKESVEVKKRTEDTATLVPLSNLTTYV